MSPDPAAHCGPYIPNALKAQGRSGLDTVSWVTRLAHDTISMVAIDAQGKIAAGSSSNGANHKVKLKDIDPILEMKATQAVEPSHFASRI